MPRENLPPQAYTKETLANAITWLQSQPEHVKSLVRTQDALITIYLKWKRDGDAGLENLSPAYHERLRHDLKSIRAVMDQFGPNTLQSTPHATPIPQIAQATAGPNVILEDASASPLGLDGESQKHVTVVRDRLNLSTDAEALRVLIAMGFEKIRDLLPRG